MAGKRHYRLLVGGVAALVMGAAAQAWFVDRRPGLADLRERTSFLVTSADDAGPGSLREAIFGADSATSRAQIVLRVPEVFLRTPLPPLVNPEGIEITSAGERSIIDAVNLGQGAVLDIQAPLSRLENIGIRAARGVAVRVRVDGVQMSQVLVSGSGTGVEVLTGVRGLTLIDSRLSDNGIGVSLAGGATGNLISGCRFEGHRRAGVWAAGAAAGSSLRRDPNIVLRSQFAGGAIGVAAANVPLRVENNDIVGAVEAGVYVSEGEAIVSNNRIRQGSGVGILAASALGVEITGNEIDNNGSAGVLLSSGAGVRLRDNRLHGNAFGVIVVFGDRALPHDIVGNAIYGQHYDGVVIVGGSPVLTGNQVIGNGGSGLQVLDYIDRQGARREARPLLQGTVLTGNGVDEPTRGVYREEANS